MADATVLRRPLGPTDTTLLNASRTTAIPAGSFITGLMGVLSRPFALRSEDHEDIGGAQHCDSLVGYTDQRRLDELAEACASSADDSDGYCPGSRRPAAAKKKTSSRKARLCPRTSKHYVLLTGPLSKVNVRTYDFCQGKLNRLNLLFERRALVNLTLRIYIGGCLRQVFPPNPSYTWRRPASPIRLGSINIRRLSSDELTGRLDRAAFSGRRTDGSITLRLRVGVV